MSRRWLSAVAGLAAVAAMAGTAFASVPPATLHPVRIESVTPVKTIPLRDMRNLNLPSIMQRIIGNRNYSVDAIAQLRQKLYQTGYLAPAGSHHLIPLKYAPHMQNAQVAHNLKNVQRAVAAATASDITLGPAWTGIGVPNNTPSVAPPDTNAAVGQNDVVEIVNLGYPDVGYFEIWDKSGNVIQSATPLSSLWSSGDCTSGYGDNEVKYDQFANRWIMEQFIPNFTGVCLAISATSDPTGSWYVYEFVIDPTGFTDYPKLGIWPVNDANQDAYLISTNDFTSNLYVNYVALQRSAMLTGSTAEMVVIDGPPYLSGLDFSALPSDVDGMNLPPTDDPGMFVDYISPYMYGGSTYALEMWQMTPDWSNPSNTTLTGPTAINVDPFNDGAYSCAPQPSPGECLPTLGDRLMFRLAYRNGNANTSDQTLVVNHAVTTNGTSAPIGIDWYQLDAPSGSTNAGDWAINQQGTFAPSDGNSRWMASIAQDHMGNIGMGYTISGSGLDPSVAITGQSYGTGGGIMNEPEFTLLSGTGVQETTGRWGDYSSIVTDPTDDCTFWTAQEYIVNTGSFNWSTGIGSFKFNDCSIGPIGTVTGTVTDASNGNPIDHATVTLSPGGHSGSSNSSGVYSVTAAPGTYTAAATAFGYQESDATVNITDGGTTTQNFALTTAPTAVLGGKVTDSGHGYPLYAEVKVAYNGSTVADVWTNPLKGTYRVTLPESSGYTLTVTPYVDGFTAGTATVDLSGGNTRQDFALTADSACTAPGYGLGKALAEDFDGGSFPPSGWTVATDQNNGFTAWQTNTAYQDGNYTNGSGVAADAEDNRGGPGLGAYSTSLITPPIPVTALAGGTTLAYTANYQDYPDYSDALDLDISADGGNTWTNISSWSDPSQDCGSLYSTPGCNVSMDIGSYLPQSGDFQLRWHYYDYNPNAWDWYAQIDNVSLGTTACNAIPGDLLAITASDANTGTQLSGVKITDENGNSVTTQDIASLNNRPGAFLFEPTGQHTLTASLNSYQDTVVNKNIGAGSAIHVKIKMDAGRLATSPMSLTVNAPVNATTTVTLTIGNSGTAPADWKLSSIDAPPLKPLKSLGGPGPKNTVIHCPSAVSPASLAATGGHNGCGVNGPRPKSNSPAWTQIADFPEGIADNCMAKDETGTGMIYSFGGVSGGFVTASSYVYDPSANTWTQIADLPAGLEKPACAFIGGKAYVTAGWDSSGNSSNSLYIYDPSTNSWTTGANDPDSQAGGAVAAVVGGQKLYVVGGCADSFCDGTASVAVYDPGSNTWTTAADYPHAVSWQACGGIGGKVYCAGGTAGSTFYSDAYVYDPGTNAWSSIASLPTNAEGCQDWWGGSYTNTTSGQLAIAQGVTCSGFDIISEAFAYSVASNSWSDLPGALVADYRMGSSCGFYSVGGSPFAGSTFGEVLAPGYDVCNVGPVPWLSFNPVSGTLNAKSQTTATLTIDGTGQPPRTSTTVQVVLSGNTPYGSIVIPLQVNWTFGSKPAHK